MKTLHTEKLTRRWITINGKKRYAYVQTFYINGKIDLENVGLTNQQMCGIEIASNLVPDGTNGRFDWYVL